MEEHRAFWSWAIVEVLRHTGIRIEELTELSHHQGLVQYRLPGTGELISLLHIAPSKTDAERAELGERDRRAATVNLGISSFRDIASRTVTDGEHQT